MVNGLIVFLNGVSSSGKTTIARELIARLVPFFHLSIDEYAYYIEKMENRDEKRIIPVHTEYLFHKTVQLFSDNGVDVIVDHILHDEFTKQNWFQVLSTYPVLYVGVKCVIEDLEKRERERCDRFPGQGRAQLDYTHSNMTYDIEIDTSRESSASNVRLVIEAMKKKFPKEFDNRIKVQ